MILHVRRLTQYLPLVDQVTTLSFRLRSSSLLLLSFGDYSNLSTYSYGFKDNEKQPVGNLEENFFELSISETLKEKCKI